MDKLQEVALLQTGTADIIPEQEFIKKISSGKKLKIKLGMDPTAPDLHLGHAVMLRKLKEFQQLGHEVVFLVGDFTARIGDPTGKSKTRPPLSEQEIAHNMQTYLEQAGKILDINKVTIAYNSTWLDALTSKQMVELCAKVTLARITEREDFARRIEENVAIGLHELLYPLFQGYDSVELHADVELGGTDQTFNVLMGRFLQERYGQQPQIAVIMPLLLGLDGVHKMSKSLNNAIGITEPADQAYGKLMSISDELMWHYLGMLVRMDTKELERLKKEAADGKHNPMEIKKRMAHTIVAEFWSTPEADQAQKTFEDVIQNKEYAKAERVTLPEGTESPLWVVELLKLLGAVETSSQAKRLIQEGAIIIDGVLVREFKEQVAWRTGTVVKAGKHKIYTLQ
jgi:tyrosyl-tRNA synthetase